MTATRFYILALSALVSADVAAGVALQSDTVDAKTLREVVVTAYEAKQATSASIIDTMAMKHLQPSSFTDLRDRQQ